MHQRYSPQPVQPGCNQRSHGLAQYRIAPATVQLQNLLGTILLACKAPRFVSASLRRCCHAVLCNPRGCPP